MAWEDERGIIRSCDGDVTAMPVRALHITQARSALNEARAALGLAPISFSDSTLAAGMIIKVPHLQQIRTGVK